MWAHVDGNGVGLELGCGVGVCDGIGSGGGGNAPRQGAQTVHMSHPEQELPSASRVKKPPAGAFAHGAQRRTHSAAADEPHIQSTYGMQFGSQWSAQGCAYAS